MRHLVKAAPLFVFALGLGCSGASQQQGGDKGPVTQQQRIVNISPVDLGACFAQAPALPDKINTDVLTGLLVAARPLVMECLVDPKNRGPAEESDVSVKSTLSGGKLTHTITAPNVTATGQACIGAAIDKFVATAPDWAAKAGAANNVSASAQYKHISGAMPTVKMGISESSDLAGVIRLAQPGFCDCYAPFKDAEPVMFKASLDIKKDAAAVVTMDAPKDGPGAQVAACLQPKVAALPLKITSSEVKAPYTFMFLNSARGEMFTGSAPQLAFAQYELIRNQRLASSVIAVGGRTGAAEAYQKLIDDYQAKKPITFDQLKAGCDALVKADDNYIASLEKQLELETKAVTMLGDFATKDAAWKPVQEATQGNVGETKTDLDKAKKQKDGDLAACPKLK